MKRIIMIVAVVLFSVAGAKAQNANRKGFFVELQGGAALGDVVTADIDIERNEHTVTYLKGGFAGSVDFGYRFRLSNPFAFEVKAGLWGNLGDFTDTWNVRILPGIRWTSKEFGGNMSGFLAYNIGFALGTQESQANFVIPSELGAGINFTPRFYAALVWNLNIYIDPFGRYGNIVKGSADTYKSFVDYYPKTYNTLALRLGFRF